MANTAEGLLCVAIGCLLIFLNKPFARYYAELQRRLLGLSPSRSGTRRGRVVAVFMGVAFVLLGALLLSFPSLGET